MSTQISMYLGRPGALKAATIARRLTALAVWHRYLITELHVRDDNPATTVRGPKVGVDPASAGLTVAEAGALLGAAYDDIEHGRIGTLLDVTTAARRGRRPVCVAL